MAAGRVAAKRVLISGGGGGIGHAMVLALLDEGAAVAALDVSAEALAPRASGPPDDRPGKQHIAPVFPDGQGGLGCNHHPRTKRKAT